jgi:hypothetical protein
LEFQALPAVAPGYLKALLSSGNGLEEGETIPRIEARIRSVVPDPERVEGYRRVCGFPESYNLPLSYPHVLAFPLQLQVMTHKVFPLKLLGLVHVRNSISQYKAIAADKAVDLYVFVEEHREVKKGLEFDLVTRVYDGTGELLWESTSTMLSKADDKEADKKDKEESTQQPQVEFGRYASFRVPAGIGRLYARQSGDINPIHLSALSARLFGFPKAIAHGMWLLARTAAELYEELPTERMRYDAAFKLPVLLPSWVLLKYHPANSGLDLALLSEDGEKPHVLGQMAALQ